MNIAIYKRWMMILFLVAGIITVQAEFQFIDDFEAETEHIDGDITAGGGGVWDTTSGATGLIKIDSIGGSNTLRFMTVSSGDGRGVGVAGMDDTIENSERGLVFCRFNIRVDSNDADTYIGLHVLTGDTPFGNEHQGNPENYIVAGFHAVDAEDGSMILVSTIDESVVIAEGLARGQWYNVWIDVDNTTDTFNLFITEADAPAGPATLPTAADRVAANIPFSIPTAEPITGLFFATPSLDQSSRSTSQSARSYVDEVYWDGANGFTCDQANNPYPTVGQTLVSIDQILSWDAPDDPNITQIFGYTVYLDPNETFVASGNPIALVSADQSGLTHTPTSPLGYDTQYFWRVDTAILMDNDPNHDEILSKGDIWSFRTQPNNPVILQQPSGQVRGPANEKPDAFLSIDALYATAYQWYKDEFPLSGQTDSTLTITDVQLSDEGQYYCVVSNDGGAVPSDTVWVEYARLTGEWDFENSDASDSVGDLDGTVDDAGAAYVAGMVGTTAIELTQPGVITIPVEALSKTGIEFSISVWTRHDADYVNNSLIYGTDDSDVRILNTHVPYKTTIYFDAGDSEGYDRSSNSFGNTTLIDTWNHFAFVKDTETGEMSIYLNGVLLERSVDKYIKLAGITQFEVGQDYTGAIDGLHIYNYALDKTEVAYLYTDIAGGSICLDEIDPALVKYDFNDDCKIGIEDLGEFAANWLYCNQVPDCIDRP